MTATRPNARKGSSRSPLVLVVDDDQATVAVAQKDLGGEYRSLVASDVEAGIALASRRQVDVILLDIEIPRGTGQPSGPMSGIEAIPEFRAACPAAEVIMFSHHDRAAIGMEALRKGAFDFVVKPYFPDRLLGAIGRALERGRTGREVAYLREEVDHLKGGPFVFGRTEAMARIREVVHAAAATDATILITGETGTGKELIARAVHAQSARKDGPFVAVNLAAVPRDLVESALFGHERGAFTGALQSQPGRFETSRGGTLLFDEIGELAPETQVKLLRVLQEGEIERVGGTRIIETDVRIVAATNRDLRARIKEGAFREDLFFRLNVVPIALPPLRERLEDLPALVTLFVERYARKYGREVPAVDPAVLSLLRMYEWPGNIRELEHLVQRIVVLKPPGQPIVESDLPIEYRYPSFLGKEEAQRSGTVLRSAMEALEQDFIVKTLERCNWNRNEAAALLGIHPATLFRKLNRHGLYRTVIEPVNPAAGRRGRGEPEES